MKHLLLVTDMDHTLLDDRPGVSPENLEAIARYVAEGGLFTVATGRAPDAIRTFPELLPYIGLPVVTGNGGQVCDLSTGEVFLRRVLPQPVEDIFYELLEVFPLFGAAAYFDLDGFDNLRSNENVEDLIRREGRPATLRTPWESPKPWNKLLLTTDHGYLEEMRSWLTPRLEGLARTVFSEDTFLEILPLGVSKGTALQIILDRAGLTPEQVVAVGDAPNDLEMLELAGVGVAVSNAHPEILAAADEVVCSNNEHAIRACLERFFKGQHRDRPLPRVCGYDHCGQSRLSEIIVLPGRHFWRPGNYVRRLRPPGRTASPVLSSSYPRSGGLHTPQGSYPRRSASSNSRTSALSLRYRHPVRWYFSPVSVTYTVPLSWGTTVSPWNSESTTNSRSRARQKRPTKKTRRLLFMSTPPT